MRIAVSTAVLVLVGILPAAAAPASVAVAEWQVIGPFESGSREGLVHPLAGPGGVLPSSWDLEKTWPSALADMGRVAWKRVEGERDEAGALTGAVKIELGGADFDAREKEWGPAAVANVAVLVGRFDLPEDALLVVDASRCGGTIGGQPFAGDPYGAGIARSVVRGRKGANEVVLLSAGFGGSRNLTFLVEPVDPGAAPLLLVASDIQLPDLVAGRPGAGVAGVPVVNLTNDWIGVEIAVESEVVSGGAVARWSLAPLSPMKIPVALRWDAPAGEPRDVEVRIRATTSRGSADAVAKVAVRAPGLPRVETFVSRIDGSAQVFGVRPSKRGDEPGQGLIMSTHGAGVGALGQASSYGPKDGFTIVAPTNRRPFGFDWHDWGRLDFEEVLDLAKARFRPDPNRVHLTGHSMGGHGAWSLGTLHADELATVAPAAGWASYDTYVPFTARRSTWLASPELNALLMRGLATGRVSPLLENLVGVPVQVLHGGKDDNVPPTQARMLTGLLERLGGSVTYVEAPDAGHWSDLDLGREGADAVDPLIMDAFWGGHVRDPWPRRLVFTTPDMDVDAERHWLRIDAQATTASESRIEAEVVSPRRVELRTRGVTALAVLLAPELGLEPEVSLVVDGDELRAPTGGSWLALRRRPDLRWTRSAAAATPPRSPDAHPGGLAKALFTPFAIVMPTDGDPARCEALAAVARLVATSWWVRGNGLVPIVADRDVTPALRAERNLLLVGGPDVNAETARQSSRLLVRSHPGGATVHGRRVPGNDLACAHWQPNPEAPSRRLLVLQATSLAGDALLPGLHPIAAGLGLPDYVVASPRVRIAGFGGFEAAGFWAPDWKLDPASSWWGAGSSRAGAR